MISVCLMTTKSPSVWLREGIKKKNGASINGPIKNVSLYFICYLHITTLYKKMKYIFTCIHIRKIVIAINGVRPSVSCFADVSPSLTVFGHNRYQRAVLGPGKVCVGWQLITSPAWPCQNTPWHYTYDQGELLLVSSRLIGAGQGTVSEYGGRTVGLFSCE